MSVGSVLRSEVGSKRIKSRPKKIQPEKINPAKKNLNPAKKNNFRPNGEIFGVQSWPILALWWPERALAEVKNVNFFSGQHLVTSQDGAIEINLVLVFFRRFFCQLSCAKCHVPCVMCQVSSIMCPSVMSQISCVKCHVSNIQRQVLSVGGQLSGVKWNVSSIMC